MLAYISEMGLTYEQMLDLSWDEFRYYSDGYTRQIERRLDNTRRIMATMVNLWSKRKIKPTDLMKLSIDEVKYDYKKLSLEEVKEISDKWPL